MRRLLVTGATGFIGRSALDLLAGPGWEAHACGRGEGPAFVPGHARWHRADVTDPAACDRLLRAARPTDLLHLAWYTKHGEYWQSSENVVWVEASLRLIRRFREWGGRRAVVAGSCAEYDWSNGVCSETETPLRPLTRYGASKDLLRQQLNDYAVSSGLSWAWGRVFFTYGPGEQAERLVPSVIRALLENQPARCTTGLQKRDFLHVSDVASALVHLVESDVQGPVNVGSGEATAIRTVVETIGELLARPNLVQLGALPDRPDDPDLLVADTGRLTREVGWRPRVSLREGLADAIEFHRGTRGTQG